MYIGYKIFYSRKQNNLIEIFLNELRIFLVTINRQQKPISKSNQYVFQQLKIFIRNSNQLYKSCKMLF